MTVYDFIYNNLSTILFINGMLICGTINTLLTKYQDSVCVESCDTNPIYFQQPLLQTFNMFLGEITCLIVYIFLFKNEYQLIEEPVEDIFEIESIDIDSDSDNVNSSENKYMLLLFPALCDTISSTLMNVGLVYVSASIFQMLRGSMVIFTGLVSILFLNKSYTLKRWSGLCAIFFGLIIVGASNNNDSGNFIGISLILLAQLFSASQYVIEEKILNNNNVSPLLAVGLEGIFGTIIIIIIMIICQLIGYNFGSKHDILTGLYQVVMYPQIYLPSIFTIFSISLFNWFGLSITKNISSTTRSTIDITRTLLIWCLSLLFRWETFKWLQVVGFTTMISGIILFNF